MCRYYSLFSFKFDINGNFFHKAFSHIPTPTEIIPISIPMEICFSFAFPWESRGIPNPTGNPIPMHISTVDLRILHNANADCLHRRDAC